MRLFVAIVVAIYLGPASAQLAAWQVGGIAGFAASVGDLKSGIIGALTGAFVYAVEHGVNKLASNSNQANARTTDGSRKTTYVGGARDSSTEIVKGMFDQHDGDAYFEWTQGSELADWMDANQSSELTVIGHSYGGDTAAGVVAGGHFVDNLITVDPVGWVRPDFSSVSANSGNWVNYDSVGTGVTFNNAIATISGAWNGAPRGFADQHIGVKLGHVDICFAHCRP